MYEAPKLTRLDAQILAAFVLQAEAIAAAGDLGAEAIDLIIGGAKADVGKRLAAATMLLGYDKPVNPDEMMGKNVHANRDERVRIAVDNLERGIRLAKGLFEYAMKGVEGSVPTEKVMSVAPTVIDVDKDGNPVFAVPDSIPEAASIQEPTVVGTHKAYRLDLTHNEIHLLFWALNLAEATDANDLSGMVSASQIYSRVRKTELKGNDGVDAFAHKFDQTHRLARIADGEGDWPEDAPPMPPDVPFDFDGDDDDEAVA